MRLVACPSVSPDVEGETRCAREIAAALPSESERGAWHTPDGRPIPWCFVPGTTRQTVVLLAHYDTVGVGEFGQLGDPRGTAIAFDPDAVRERLIDAARSESPAFDPLGMADLSVERHEPGTWMFGRGGLDMKSGVAIGIALTHALASRREPLACGVLFVAAPDEENVSAGMIAAIRELRALRDARGLTLAGLLNLDYGDEPAAYVGAMGKLEIGCFVIGRPTHVSLPFAGIDAAELAAAIVTRVTRSRELVDRAGDAHSMPASTMRLRDLKEEYNVQTILEAYVEFNLITASRPLERTLEIVRREAALALHGLRQAHTDLAAWLSPGASTGGDDEDALRCVLTVPELAQRAEARSGSSAVEDGAAAIPSTPARDARTATLERLRHLARQAHLAGPAVIVHLVPPFYPHAAPGDGPLVQAVRAALVDEPDIAVKNYYPSISDACYASWRAEPVEVIARHMPALGREYHLPFEDARSLDLDVVNLGAWGRDGHGLMERVHAGYAFERLPRLLGAVLEQLSRLAGGDRVTHEERT